MVREREAGYRPASVSEATCGSSTDPHEGSGRDRSMRRNPRPVHSSPDALAPLPPFRMRARGRARQRTVRGASVAKTYTTPVGGRLDTSRINEPTTVHMLDGGCGGGIGLLRI